MVQGAHCLRSFRGYTFSKADNLSQSQLSLKTVYNHSQKGRTGVSIKRGKDKLAPTGRGCLVLRNTAPLAAERQSTLDFPDKSWDASSTY